MPTHDRTGGDVVLVVDDSPESLGMLTDTLEESGLTVVVATGGQSALQLVDRIRPDIILLDAKMPGLDGFATCRALKMDKGLVDVPVLFMTGLSETEHIVKGFESGGVDYITKPIVPDELIARMRVHLANARMSRSARAALDASGRVLMAIDASGGSLWCTPQASDLLRAAGCRYDGSRFFLPQEAAQWITQTIATDTPDRAQLKYRLAGPCEHSIWIRIAGRIGNEEILIRLVRGAGGEDEKRLAQAFNLTPREADVLLWVSRGKSNKDVGELLDLSPRTVNKHLEQIFVKLGVENRTAAAAHAVRVLWE